VSELLEGYSFMVGVDYWAWKFGNNGAFFVLSEYGYLVESLLRAESRVYNMFNILVLVWKS